MSTKEEDEKKKRRIDTAWAVIWGIVLVAISVVIIYIPIKHVQWYYPTYNEQTGHTGDTIGGMTAPFVGLLGAFLVFLALRAQIRANNLITKQISDQKDENEAQKRILVRQNFETTFFNLMTIHQGFVEQILVNRNAVVKQISDRLKSPDDQRLEMEHINEVNPEIYKRAFFKPTYLMIRDSVNMVDGRNEPIDTIPSVYLHNEVGDDSFFPQPIFTNYQKQALTFRGNTIDTGFHDVYRHSYDFLNADLGHYFRNLYRMIKMVDDREFLEKNEAKEFETKYFYTSIVRSQLSDYEVYWLFMNGLFPLGKEFKKYIEKYSLLKVLDRTTDEFIIDLKQLYAPKAFGKEKAPQ